MEPRISLVTLGVTDLERALRFYRDGLGWRPSSASVEGDVAFFQVGPMVLALWSRAELAKDAGLFDGGGWGAVALAHNVRSREEADVGRGPGDRRRRAPAQGGRGDGVGRLLGLHRGSRRPSVGDRVEPALADRGGRVDPAARLLARTAGRHPEDWRRGRDSNPRWVAPYRISSAAP